MAGSKFLKKVYDYQNINAHKNIYLLTVLLLAFFLAGLIHWSSAPKNGDYWWPDSSRHMLNAIFIKDAFIARPFHNPMEWASAYYNQFPAITLGFYPPGFSCALGFFFLIVGASHSSAQIFMTGSFLLLVFSLSLYTNSRGGIIAGLLAGGLAITAPEFLIWSRQIQPEIPSIALGMLAITIAEYERKHSDLRVLLLSIFVFASAAYFKQTVIVIAPLFLWTIFHERSNFLKKILRNRAILATAFGVFLLIPLIVFQIKFGGENLRSIQGIQDAPYSLNEIENWTWYFKQLTKILGWPLTLVFSIGIATLLIAKKSDNKTIAYILIFNTILIYFIFSAIALKEQRHIQPILIPIIILGSLGFSEFLYKIQKQRIGTAILLAWSIIQTTEASAPKINGPENAAKSIYDLHPYNCTILIHMKQDGNFITNLRLLDHDRNCTIIRSDKILFNVTIRRGLGISEKLISTPYLSQFFYDYGIKYVVMDPGFWNDLENSKIFISFIHSNGFNRIKQIPVRIAEPGSPYKEASPLEIYENNGPARDPILKLNITPSM